MEKEFTAQDAAATAVKQYHNTLPKVGMELNSRVLVRLNPLGQKLPPMQGEYLGGRHYEFLIISLPSTPGLLKYIIPHSMVELSYMSEGSVNSFRSEVLSHSVKPRLVLYTSYPDRIHIKETRRHRRVACALPVTLHSAKGDASGMIFDLSMGGCRLALNLSGQSALRDLAVGDWVVIQTVLNTDGLPCGGAAAVRNVETSGSKLLAGLSFTEKHPDFMSALDNYISMVENLV
jgi:hypothetical protein